METIHGKMMAGRHATTKHGRGGHTLITLLLIAALTFTLSGLASANITAYGTNYIEGNQIRDLDNISVRGNADYDDYIMFGAENGIPVLWREGGQTLRIKSGLRGGSIDLGNAYTYVDIILTTANGDTAFARLYNSSDANYGDDLVIRNEDANGKIILQPNNEDTKYYEFTSGDYAVISCVGSICVIDDKVNISDTLTIGEYTLPETDGASGYVLKTDGEGNVVWVEPSIEGLTDTKAGFTVTVGPQADANYTTDGVNDGVQIEAACDYVKEVHYKTNSLYGVEPTVKLLTGIFNIAPGDTINCSGNSTFPAPNIEGSGIYSTVINASASYNLVFNWTAYGNSYDKHKMFGGMTIVGNTSGYNQGSTAIEAGLSSRGYIHDLLIYFMDTGIDVDGSTLGKIENVFVRFGNTGLNAFGAPGGGNKQLVMEQITLFGNVSVGGYDDFECYGCDPEGSNFYIYDIDSATIVGGWGEGAGVNLNFTDTDNVNVFGGSRAANISLTNADNTVIVGMYDGTDKVFVDDTSTGVVFITGDDPTVRINTSGSNNDVTYYFGGGSASPAGDHNIMAWDRIQIYPGGRYTEGMMHVSSSPDGGIATGYVDSEDDYFALNKYNDTQGSYPGSVLMRIEDDEFGDWYWSFESGDSSVIMVHNKAYNLGIVGNALDNVTADDFTNVASDPYDKDMKKTYGKTARDMLKDMTVKPNGELDADTVPEAYLVTTWYQRDVGSDVCEIRDRNCKSVINKVCENYTMEDSTPFTRCHDYKEKVCDKVTECEHVPDYEMVNKDVADSMGWNEGYMTTQGYELHYATSLVNQGMFLENVAREQDTEIVKNQIMIGLLITGFFGLATFNVIVLQKAGLINLQVNKRMSLSLNMRELRS